MSVSRIEVNRPGACKAHENYIYWTETKAMIAPQLLVKLHINMMEKFGSAVLYKAILEQRSVL